MKLTREAFDEWRGSSTTEIIFALLAKHAEKIERTCKNGMWMGGAPEAWIADCRAEVKNMTQFITMDFEHFDALTEDGADNE